MTMYLVLSAFTSIPKSLLVTAKAFRKILAILNLSAHVGRGKATVHLVIAILQIFLRMRKKCVTHGKCLTLLKKGKSVVTRVEAVELLGWAEAYVL
jgi:hypothetical protein